MKKPIEGETVFRHWSEYEEHPDRYIVGIEFRPEEDLSWNYRGCPPYMVAYTDIAGENAEFYLLPPSMAYYAATHQGWCRQGRKNKEEDARDGLRFELRKLLGVIDPD